MADFAIYSALSGRRDWSQVRADRQNELIYLKQMQNDLQNRIQTEAQARAGVVEYMQQINQATVLEGDLERIKAVESDARKKIVEGLKAAGNDYNKFLLGNGAAELQNYYNTVMQSDAMKDAVNNKVNAAQYALDTYMGRQVRPISITMPDGTQKSISFEDQMKMYESGQLNRINYAGSVKPVQLVEIQDAIQKTFGKNPYSRQKASKEDIYEYAQRFGAEDWQAEQLANQYEAGMINGAETPIYFNYKEPPKEDATSAYLKSMMRKLSDNPYRVYDDAAAGKYAKEIIAYEDSGKTKPLKDLQGNTFGVAITDFANDAMRNDFANSAGIRTKEEDGEKKMYFTGTAYSAKNLEPIDISSADIIDIQNIGNVMYKDDMEKAKQSGTPYYGTPMVKVKVAYPNAGGLTMVLHGDDYAAQQAGVWDNDWWRLNWFSKEDASETQKGNFKKENGQVVGEVYIPVNMSNMNRALNNAPKSEFDDYNLMQQLQDAAIMLGAGM